MTIKIRTTYEPGSLTGGQMPPKLPSGPLPPRQRPEAAGQPRHERRGKRGDRWGRRFDGFM